MFKTLASLITKRRTLNAEIELDHLELSRDQLIVGLRITWTNDTAERLEIQEVSAQLFHKGKKEAPIVFPYHGRFVRIPFQKTVTKIAGANSFPLKAGSSLVENIRFLNREIRDLHTATYDVELHTTVADGTYVHTFEVKVAPELKSRVDGPEQEAGALAAPSSSAFTRALRIGLNPNPAKSSGMG